VACNLIGAVGLTALVVVAREEGASVRLPEILLYGGDAGCGAGLLSNTREDVEPCDNRPKSVLLTDVVAAGSEALLTADIHLIRIEKTAEELPASGHLIALDTLLLCDEVNRARSRHASCETVDALLLEVRNELGVVCDDGQAVTGRDEAVRSVDHVAVAITVAGRTKMDAVLVNRIDEGLGIYKVGIGVVAAEIGLGDAVLGAVGDAQLLLEDVDAV
jgi:SHS2 domain-containing protein